jgi:asparagine synthase (glutamine-hydrolysing)
VKVCLTGDGGDEMFAGYPIFDWAASVRRLGRVPTGLLKTMSPAVSLAGQLAPAKFGDPIRQAGRAMAAAMLPEKDQIGEIMSLFLSSDVEKLVTDSETKKAAMGPLNPLTDLPEDASEWSGLRRTMYTSLTKGLPGDMLVKTDRMSMATSLELRAPFLGTRLADVSFMLPDRFLRSGKTGKLVLRQVVKDMLPESVFTHPKSGFSIPLHSFQNSEYVGCAETLLRSSSPIYDLVDQEEVTRIKNRALSAFKSRGVISRYRASHQLWSLIQLAAWLERFNVAV